VGRLTQALARYFSSVTGLDISSEMINLARNYNKFDKKIVYVCNERKDLLLFKNLEFDFIYSNIVLQHMEERYFLKYVAEFIRILNKKGILIFQLPCKITSTFRKYIPTSFVNTYKKLKYGAIMEMHTYNKNKMIDFLKRKRFNVLKSQEIPSAKFMSCWYYVEKK